MFHGEMALFRKESLKTIHSPLSLVKFDKSIKQDILQDMEALASLFRKK